MLVWTRKSKLAAVAQLEEEVVAGDVAEAVELLQEAEVPDSLHVFVDFFVKLMVL